MRFQPLKGGKTSFSLFEGGGMQQVLDLGFPYFVAPLPVINDQSLSPSPHTYKTIGQVGKWRTWIDILFETSNSM